MKHTFLLQAGTWSGKAYLIDRQGHRLEAAARAEVSHAGEAWINRGEIAVLSDPPVKFETTYRIAPLTEASDTTTCKSENSALGFFTGTIIIVGDSILTAMRGDDGDHWSIESLQQVSPTEYHGRGAYFAGGERVMSWIVELQRNAG